MRIRPLPLFGLLACACAAPLPPTRPPTPAQLAQLRARARSDHSSAAQVALGSALRLIGQPDSARALLAPLVAAEPRNGGAVMALALAEEDLGEFGRAGELYQRALALGLPSAVRRQVQVRVELVQRKELTLAMRQALSTEYQLSQAPPEARTLGIFPFMYAGRDAQLAPLGRALTSLLTTDLSQTPRLRVLERDQVQALLGEMRLSGSGLVDSSTAVRSGRLLRASRIVEGRIGGDTSALRIAATVVPVGSAVPAPAAPVQVQDAIGRLFDMEKQLALGLYDAMGVQLTVAERERVEHRATRNLQALLEFGWGLDEEDAGRWPEAARHYRTALAFDPGFAEARQRARRAERMAQAASTSTNDLDAFWLAGTRAAPAPGRVLPGVVVDPISVVGLDPVRVLLPDPIARNPGAELLGFDGLGISSILQITAKKP